MKISNEEMFNIKTGKQIYLISSDDSYNNKDIVILESKNENIEVEITIKYKYNTLDDCFELIPFNLFGNFETKDEAIKCYKNIKNFTVYRIKYDRDSNLSEIINEELLELIDVSSIRKNTVGHSSSEVFELKLKDGTNAILKVQHLNGRNNLRDEYERNKWLENKLNVPKIYYFSEKDKVQYYLMERKSGVSAHKVDGFARLIGENLKKIHSIDISDCPFNNNLPNKLFKLAVDKIDIILPTILELYPDMDKNSIIDFLRNNIPKDLVLVHGDYSLPNILIDDKNEISLIDLGDVSISTKYFDLYYLKKSFIRNKKSEYFEDFLYAYGMVELDDKSMKWMDIIDKVLF